MRAALSVALGLALAWPAAAAERAPEHALRPGPTATVARVVDGDTVVLAAPVMEATHIRLVGLQAPKLPLGREGFPTWPMAGDAKIALEGLVLGKAVGLSFGGAERDRHGRLLAHLTGPDGRWVQGEMLRLGMARVYSFADNRSRVRAMLALEEDARAHRRGIWGHPYYAVRRAEPPGGLYPLVGTFQLVEGVVRNAARVKARVYLNFGADWRSDFTVALDGRARRLFKKSGLDPLALEGRRVRVRGWIKKFNGPLIDATHPEQIEVLSPAPPAGDKP